MDLFNLFAKLTLDTSNYEKGLNQAGKSASSFSSKFGSAMHSASKVATAYIATLAAVATALTALALSTVSYGDDIDKSSQKVSMSTTEYQQWSYILDLCGASADSLTTIVRYLTNFTDELTEGDAESLLALQELGIGYDEFIAASYSDKLEMIIEAMQEMTDETERNTLAEEIFGRSYTELLPLLNQSSDYIDEVKQSMEDMGLIMSEDAVAASAELSDQLTTLKLALQIAASEAGTELYPVIEKVVNWLIDTAIPTLTNVVNWLSENSDWLGTVAIALGVVAAAIWVVNAAIWVVNAAVSANPVVLAIEAIIVAIAAITAVIIIFKDDIVAWFKSVGDWFVDIWDKIVDTFTGLGEWFQDNVFKPIGNFFVTMVNGIISGFENMINWFVKGINNILSSATGWLKWFGVDTSNWQIKEVSFSRLSYFAEGGMFNQGTAYAIAGENGAEIVAQGRYGTGVANVEQIAEAVYSGMMRTGINDTISNAAVAVVNGVLSGNKTGTGANSQNTEITVKIGDTAFKGYLVKAVNDTLNSRGRKSLNKVTAY